MILEQILLRLQGGWEGLYFFCAYNPVLAGELASNKVIEWGVHFSI